MLSNSESSSTERKVLPKKPFFRKAFCLKAGFKYEPLKPYCEGIVLCTDGFSTNTDVIAAQLVKNLKDFDPSKDCIIPVGTPLINLITGYILANQFPKKTISFGFFQRPQENWKGEMIPAFYVFEEINLSSIT